MTNVTTRTDLKRAIVHGDDTICIQDPKLCHHVLTRKQARPLRDRLMMFALYVRGYTVTAKRSHGAVSVVFKKNGSGMTAGV